MQADFHCCNDPEIAAAAAQRPQQFLLVMAIGNNYSPNREDHLCGEHVVQSEPEADRSRATRTVSEMVSSLMSAPIMPTTARPTHKLKCYDFVEVRVALLTLLTLTTLSK